MTRHILCAACAAKAEKRGIHPEDAAMGFQRRIVYGKSKKPEDLHIEAQEGASVNRINLAVMRCDYCDASLPDGSDIAAMTVWRGPEPLTLWEQEYMQARAS